jgi:CheY-like chemotaxis protein
LGGDTLNSEHRSSALPWLSLIVFLPLAVVVGASGHFYFAHLRNETTEQKKNELYAISELKVRQLCRGEGNGSRTPASSLTAGQLPMRLRGYAKTHSKQEIENRLWVDRHEISLALTDMGLPRLSGTEEFIRLREITPKLKVILASGYLDAELKTEMLNAGARHLFRSRMSLTTFSE